MIGLNPPIGVPGCRQSTHAVLLPIAGDTVVIPSSVSMRANSLTIEEGVLLRILNNATLRLIRSDTIAIHNFGTIICTGDIILEDATDDAFRNEASGCIDFRPASTIQITRGDARGFVNHGMILNQGEILVEDLKDELLDNLDDFINAGTIDAIDIGETNANAVIYNRPGDTLINEQGASITLRNISGSFFDGIRNNGFMRNQGLFCIDEVERGDGIQNYGTLVNTDSIVVTHIRDGHGINTSDSLFNTSSANISIQSIHGINAGLDIRGFMRNSGMIKIDSLHQSTHGLENAGRLVNFDSILISNVDWWRWDIQSGFHI